MGYLGDSLRALALTLKNAFRQPVTVQFPAETRQRAERFRPSSAPVSYTHRTLPNGEQG